MSGLDVEALLDSTAAANGTESNGSASRDDDRHRSERNERRDRDRARDGSRDGDNRKRRGSPGDDLKGPGSDAGSSKSRRRSTSRDADRRGTRRNRDDGDYYRGGGRPRTRSRSPNGRYYRPHGRDDGYRGGRRNDRRGGGRSRSPRGGKDSRNGTPPLTEDERDKRTIFVQQLAARLRTKELAAFFEKVGPVKEAQIVKDRVSGRSKG